MWPSCLVFLLRSEKLKVSALICRTVKYVLWHPEIKTQMFAELNHNDRPLRYCYDSQIWIFLILTSVNVNLYVLLVWKKCSEELVNSTVTFLSVYWVGKALVTSIFVYLLEHTSWRRFFSPARREIEWIRLCVCVCVSVKVVQPSVPISTVLSKQAQVNVPWQTHTASTPAFAYHIYTIFILHNHSGQTWSLSA